MTKEEKEKIIQMTVQSNDSVSNLVRMALLGLAKDFDGTYQRGYNHGEKNGKKISHEDGVAEGKKQWAIWVFCRLCKKPIYIEPNEKIHNKILQRMTDEYHSERCPPE